MRILQSLDDNAFEVVRAHQFEQLGPLPRQPSEMIADTSGIR